MKKVILRLALVFFTAGLLFSAELNSESDFRVDIASDGNSLKIVEYTGSSNTVVIPDTIEGYPVTEIGADTFNKKKEGLVSVTIPSSVTTILGSIYTGLFANANCEIIFNDIKNIKKMGHNAFFNFNGKITLADGTPFTAESLKDVNYFGEDCFYKCKTLTGKIVLSSNIESIGSYAFGETNITEVVFDGFVGYKNGRVLMGNGAFARCNNLESVSILNNAVLSHFAFSDCKSLKELKFERNIGTEIQVFSGCTSLTEVKFTGNVVLGKETFEDCTSLTKVEFLDNATVKLDGAGIFENCTSLTDVVIAENAKFSGSYSFSQERQFKNCPNLTIKSKFAIKNAGGQ